MTTTTTLPAEVTVQETQPDMRRLSRWQVELLAQVNVLILSKKRGKLLVSWDGPAIQVDVCQPAKRIQVG